MVVAEETTGVPVSYQPATDDVLTASGLNVVFRVGHDSLHAVSDVSLRLRPGEMVGIVGESGCGKSTLARALLRLIPLASGEIEFLGERVSELGGRRLRAMRRNMQMVFQDPHGSLDPRMTVAEIVGEPLTVHRLADGKELDRRVRRMAELVGLDEQLLGRRPAQLSGGQQQRVGIARALITEPKLVVCDEPTASLDVSIQAQVINLLQDLQEELDVTFVFIAHNLAIVRHACNRVLVMYLGVVAEEASSEDLFARPLHPYTRGLIAAIPVPDVHARTRLADVQRLVAGEIPSMMAPPAGCRYHTRCPYATQRCHDEVPELEDVLLPDEAPRRVACHHWRDIAELEPHGPEDTGGSDP